MENDKSQEKPEEKVVTSKTTEESTPVEVHEKTETQTTPKPAGNKNKKIILIIVGVVVLLLLCCCCGPFLYSSMFGAAYQNSYMDFLDELEKEAGKQNGGTGFDYDYDSDPGETTTYTMGEVAVNGDLGITAVKIEDPYDYTGTFDTTEEGKRLVAVEIEVTNNSTAAEAYSPYYFKLKDENNYEYSYEYLTAKEPLLQGGNLNPEETVKGWLTFSVPEEAVKLVLTHEDVLSGSKVEIELN